MVNIIKEEITLIESLKKIVQYLINTNLTLKATYECYQGLINSLK